MQKINWKKEICTIPNLLSLFRLTLIPVYLNLYLNAETAREYTLSAVILGVSCMTDLVDGKIARKFNMISNVGKVLDPLADKLTQLSLLICLYGRSKILRFLLLIFLIKEFWQLFAMIGAMRQGKALNGALMSGKISTTVLFLGLGLIFLFPTMGERTVNCICLVCLTFLLYAFADYAQAYFGKNKRIYDLE